MWCWGTLFLYCKGKLQSSFQVPMIILVKDSLKDKFLWDKLRIQWRSGFLSYWRKINTGNLKNQILKVFPELICDVCNNNAHIFSCSLYQWHPDRFYCRDTSTVLELCCHGCLRKNPSPTQLNRKAWSTVRQFAG